MTEGTMLHSLRRRLTSRSDVKRGLPHNEWGFSNRMLDK